MTTVDRIKMLAKKRGWSLQKVAEEAGIGINSIYRWNHIVPSTASLEKVAKVFNVSTDYLLGRDETVTTPDEHDLDRMLDNARSFNGKPMTDHDREIVRRILKGLYSE